MSLPPDQRSHLFAAALQAQRALQLEEAGRGYRVLSADLPDQAGPWHLMGLIALQAGDLTRAEALVRRAVALDPLLAFLHNDLGAIAKEQERMGLALDHYRGALAIDPAYAEAHNNMGAALRDAGQPVAAMSAGRRAVRLRQDYAEAHANFSLASREAGAFTLAETSGRIAVALAPALAPAYNNLSGLMRDLGHLVAARRYAHHAVDLAPPVARFHYTLAEVTTFSAEGPELARLEALAGKTDSLPIAERVHLHFALGKAYADCGETDRSFRQFLTGNALHRAGIAYDESVALGRLDGVKAVFSHDVLASAPGLAEAGAGPIFIVGMPRSGSTLVEQILASHSGVTAGGELTLLDQAIETIVGRGAFPEASDADLLRRIGEAYLSVLPVSSRFTDKNPANFLHCGLISLALPGARIVHVSRDPVDTCLSSFSKLFNGDQPYNYDLGELGRYYRAYASLMRYWRDVLPQRVLLDVRYEALVDDVEGQVRRLLDFCGLAWEPACLSFERNQRAVRTASATQVRRPLYRTSIGRPRPSPNLLKPLIDALELASPEGAERPLEG